MSAVLLFSIGIRIAALGLSLLLLRRLRDWRIGFLSGMIFLMAMRQILTLTKKPIELPISFTANIDELPGLLVSVLVFLALVFLGWMIRERDSLFATLKVSEQRFRDFAEVASDYFWEMDADLRFSYFSERFSEITGVPPEMLLGKTRQETGIPSVDETMWQRLLADLAAHRPFNNFVHPRTKSDGEVIWLSISARPVFDHEGGFKGYRGTGTDITERRLAEEALRESEKRTRVITDAVPALISYIDAGERYRFVNKAYEEWFGRPRADIIGERAADLITPDAYKIVQPHIAAALSGQSVTFEAELVYGSGPPRHVRATYIPEIGGQGDVTGMFVLALDITERKRANEALRESERRYRGLFDHAVVGIYRTTPDGRHLEVNPALARMRGCNTSAEFMAHFLDARHPIYVDPAAREEMSRLMREQGYIMGFESESYRRDSTRFWMSETGRAVRDETGQLIAYEGFILDITERKIMSEELALSENRLKQAARLAKLGHWIWDAAEERYIHCSEEQARIHGYSLEDFLARGSTVEGDLSFTHPEDRELYQAALGGLRKGEDFDIEYRVVTPGGETRYVREIARPIFDENGTVVQEFGTIQDITETKRVEEDATRLGRILDDSPVETYSIDIDSCRFIDVNRGARENLGYSIDELRQLTPADVAPKFDPTRFKERIKILKQGQQDHFAYETVHRRKDGSTYPVRLRLQLATYHGTQVLFGIAEDITERLRTEEQLRQAQKMEAVGQLTGGIAHDFNNLLAVVIGNLELLDERLRSGGDPADLAFRALTSAERGAELTRHLLAFSRQQALQPEVVNANTIIKDMIELLQRTLGEHIEIETVAATGLRNCEVDPVQLESALVNLAVNARDAMPDGGKLTIETANARLDDAYAAAQIDVEPGDYVLIAVSDTGSGMEPEMHEQVFEPFFTTKEVGKGTGLGLSMVYGFVKQSGGHIAIYSEVGEGTTIKLYLPRYKGEKAAVEGREQADASVSGKGEVILVVEDDADLRTMIINMLQSLGYGVLESGTARSALEILEETSHVNLLLTDVVLPGGMNGRALADQAQEKDSNLPLLYMSGYTENAVIRHGRLDEGVLLLEKPFRKADLARAVRKALDSGPA